MHKKKSLGLLGLAAFALSIAGCCCMGNPPCGGGSGGYEPVPPGGTGPGSIPQIVEIMRNSTGQIVGYVATNPSNANVSWWLLKSGETPPVMPDAFFTPANDVVWRARNETVPSAAALCNMFGVSLGTGRKLYILTSNGGTPCNPQ